MDKGIYLTLLYDIYSSLLNDKEKKYFEAYYFDNLSFGEISENYNVSRNAIFKSVKLTSNKLVSYENALKLYEKGLKLSKIIDEIDDRNIKDKLNEIRW